MISLPMSTQGKLHVDSYDEFGRQSSLGNFPIQRSFSEPREFKQLKVPAEVAARLPERPSAFPIPYTVTEDQAIEVEYLSTRGVGQTPMSVRVPVWGERMGTQASNGPPPELFFHTILSVSPSNPNFPVRINWSSDN